MSCFYIEIITEQDSVGRTYNKRISHFHCDNKDCKNVFTESFKQSRTSGKFSFCFECKKTFRQNMNTPYFHNVKQIFCKRCNTQFSARGHLHKWCDDCSCFGTSTYLENMRLLSRYGITLSEFLKMLDNQNHKCVLCDKNLNLSDRKTICVDHCHQTGKVRGVLCKCCNFSIASAEQEGWLERAKNYLTSIESSLR